MNKRNRNQKLLAKGRAAKAHRGRRWIAPAIVASISIGVIAFLVLFAQPASAKPKVPLGPDAQVGDVHTIFSPT